MKETFVPGRSTDIAQVEYDSETGTMTVSFVKGGVYRYGNVPYMVYQSFQHAPSAGSYFHRQVRDRYGYEEL